MKYAIIFKKPFARTRSIVVDSDESDITKIAVPADLDYEEIFVEHIVDFENQQIIPAALNAHGFVEVPDGDFGDETPAEYFENQTGTMELDFTETGDQ